eukprot:2050059-Prymnesium_polylepis.1
MRIRSSRVTRPMGELTARPRVSRPSRNTIAGGVESVGRRSRSSRRTPPSERERRMAQRRIAQPAGYRAAWSAAGRTAAVGQLARQAAS